MGVALAESRGREGGHTVTPPSDTGLEGTQIVVCREPHCPLQPGQVLPTSLPDVHGHTHPFLRGSVVVLRQLLLQASEGWAPGSAPRELVPAISCGYPYAFDRYAGVGIKW